VGADAGADGLARVVGPMAILVWAGVAIAVVGAFGLRVPGRVTEVLRSPRASVIVAACLAFFIYVAAGSPAAHNWPHPRR